MTDMPRSNRRTDDGPIGRGKRALHWARRQYIRKARRRKALLAMQGLPKPVQLAAQWAVMHTPSDAESMLISSLEEVRAEIASSDGSELHSYSSPVPGSFELDGKGKASPGPRSAAPRKAHAGTGARPSKGVMLRRLVDGTEAARVLELGTNTGMSASYLASSSHCETLS